VLGGSVSAKMFDTVRNTASRYAAVLDDNTEGSRDGELRRFLQYSETTWNVRRYLCLHVTSMSDRSE